MAFPPGRVRIGASAAPFLSRKPPWRMPRLFSCQGPFSRPPKTHRALPRRPKFCAKAARPFVPGEQVRLSVGRVWK